MSTSRRHKDFKPSNRMVGALATVATAPSEIPNRTESPLPHPTHDDIARRAYQLYEQRGGAHGRDWEDWFQAERELRLQAVRGVIDRIVGTEESYAVA
jgi:hypothetical protein